MAHIRVPSDWHIHIHRKTDGVHALYANFFLRQMALYTFGLFVPLYLLKLMQELYGASVFEGLALIATFFLAIRILYFFFILQATRIICLVGTRWSIFFSNIFLLLYLGALTLAEKEIVFLLVAIVAVAIYAPLYWISFHYLLSSDSHDSKRGREVGKTLALERVGSIIGPLLGGIVLAEFGFVYLFTFSILLVIVSSIPPFFMHHHPHHRSISLTGVFGIVENKKNWGVLASVGASAVKDITDGVFMPVFAFLLLAGYEQMGFFYSFTGLITIGVYWLVGWLFDKYSRKRLLKVGIGLNFLVWMGRAIAFSPGILYFVESVKRIANPMLLITHQSIVYYWGRKKPLEYMMIRSLVWQLSAAGWLFLLMIGFWFGLGLRVVFAATAVVILGHMLVLHGRNR